MRREGLKMNQDRLNVKRSPSGTIESDNGPPVVPHKDLYVVECLVPPGAGLDIRCEGLFGCWREPPYAYFFFDRSVGEKARAFLEARGFQVTGRYEMAYEQWQRLPSCILDVGSFRIVFGPSEGRRPSGAQKVIFLNTGLVFGSGMHPTTRLCLYLLGRLYCPTAMMNVVDVGTGTGILALAAARLGARRVVALDVNPLAVYEAAANVRRNALEERIFPVAAEGLHALKSFGLLLLMNLEWPSLHAVLQKDCWIRFPHVLCSGYLGAHSPTVRKRLGETHRLQEEAELEGWGASFWKRPE